MLSRALVEGTLRPGQRLRDVELAAQWGISRTPVREAIQRLAQQGLLEVVPHRYTRVPLLDERRAQESIELMVLLAGASLVVGLARMTDDEHRIALELIDAAIASALEGDNDATLRTASAFFRHIGQTTQNRVLIALMEEVHLPAQRFETAWHPYISSPHGEDISYAALRRAVAARDGIAAERILRAQHAIG